MSGIRFRRTSGQGSKYHSVKIETEDGKFDSKAEYRRWLTLKSLAEEGAIIDLKRQVKYPLIGSSRRKTKLKNGRTLELAISYVADFVYIKNGELVVEDVKGFKTDVYVIKRKLMLEKYGIEIQEV